MRRNVQPLGFSLIEVMVSLAITGIVTSLALLTFAAQHNTFLSNQRAVDTQENARLALEMILADVRIAGFLVPESACISSIDGGVGGADVLCTSDPTIIDEARIQATSASFDRARLSATLSASQGTVVLTPSTLDVDGDGDDDFTVGKGIIISDGVGSHCARVVSIVGGSIGFTPPTPPGFSANAGSGRAVPANIFELTGTTLTRNTLPLSTRIENLQVEFTVDANGNNIVDPGEFPIHDLAPFDVADVGAVRVSVIARTPVANPDLAGTGMPATANHAGAPPDGLTRRRFVGSVVPRNLN